jgi:hypothetical protein
MKSKVRIGVDTDNQPIIEVLWEESEDVRDLLVLRFIESFGYNGNIAKIKIYDKVHGPGPETKKLVVRPIPDGSIISKEYGECSVWIDMDNTLMLCPLGAHISRDPEKAE